MRLAAIPAPRIIGSVLVVFALGLVGADCARDDCHSNSECGAGRICRLGLCAIDPGVDTGSPTGDATTLDIQLSCGPATAADLVVNEILADPPTGADVDGNGEADTSKDEFIEVVNIGNEPVALTNVALDVNGKQASLGAVCLNPNQARVLFGATGLPSVKNDSGTVKLVVSGVVTQTIDYGSEVGHDASITLQTQLDPSSPWVRHDTAFGTKYSPFKCANGNDFPNCAGPGLTEVSPDAADADTSSEVVQPSCSDLPVAGDLVINELLADPGTGAKPNDANKDGTVDGDGDEFVEVVNVSQKTLRIDGVKLKDASGKTTAVPSGKCLAPNQALLFLGKLVDGTDFGDVVAVGAATAGLSLNNTGDTVTLLDVSDGVLGTVTYGSDANADQSLTRQTDLDPTAPFVKHTLAPNAGGASMSPGRCQGGQSFPDCGAAPAEETIVESDDASVSEVVDETGVDDTSVDETLVAEVGPSCGPTASSADLVINEIMLAPPTGFDSDGLNGYDSGDDEYVELLNMGGASVSLDALQLWVKTTKKYTFPTGVCLAPHDAVVVYGKTTFSYTAAGATNLTPNAADYHPSLVLSNSGTTITVKDAAGATIVTETVGAASDESWTRAPDGNASAFVKHKSATGSGGLAGSPGKCVGGAALPGCLTPAP